MPDSLSMVSDEPVGEGGDRLGFAPYAAVFCTYVLSPQTPTPMTVALSGPWGSGKTSLARLIEVEVTSRDNWFREGWAKAPLTCWFNAWHHADAANLGAALAANVARRVASRRNPLWRLLQPLPVTMLPPGRRWGRRLWQGALGLVLAVAGLVTLASAMPVLRPALGAVGTAAQAPSPVLLYAAAAFLLGLAGRAFKMGGTIGGYLEEPQATAAAGAMPEVREHLGRLIRQALRRDRRLMIVIDDLERCPADKALQVCEVVSQLLDHPGVVVFVVADLEPLARAAAAKYGGDVAMGGRYLDKFVGLRFTLPPLRREVVGRLFGGER